MPTFMPGLELAERYYQGLVQPLLRTHFPGLRYAAALIGYGSEVLGFDTPMSMDHAWAPRMQLFLAQDETGQASGVDEMLKRNLPATFLGFPLGTQASLDEPGVFFMAEDTRAGDVAHKVQVTNLRDFILEELDWDLRLELEPADWLSFSSQALLAITAGRVFFDNAGELSALRQKLAFYPREIWLYLLACGWDRIGQEDALMQRAGLVGDESGSAIIASRLVRDSMSLCFLMESRYAPYPKWFGSAFKNLECAPELSPLLWQAQVAATWPERARAIGLVCELLARKHNTLKLTEPQPERLTAFHGRPFQVIKAELISGAILKSITDPEICRIAQKGPLGSLDQFSDSSILRSDPRWRQAIKHLYT